MKWINPYIARRNDMVDKQLASQGVRDERVLEAMRCVPREAFVPRKFHELAYLDEALPIGGGQTISPPYIVAMMMEALGLQGAENVLEIGTGSGYAAAVLAHLAREVHTIERVAALADRARATLRRLGYGKVDVIEGDGTLGWRAAAPYDAIVATAGGPRIPPSLRAQLKPGGRLVMPIEDGRTQQSLIRMVRGTNGDDTMQNLRAVQFVPLIGAEAWTPNERSPIDRSAKRLAIDLQE